MTPRTTTTMRRVYVPRASQRRNRHVSTLLGLLEKFLERQEWCAAASVASLLLRATTNRGEAGAKAIQAALECAWRGRKELKQAILRLMRERRQWKAVEQAYVEEAATRIVQGEHNRAVSLLDESFDFRSAYSRQRVQASEESLVFEYVCHAVQGIASYLEWLLAVKRESAEGPWKTQRRTESLGKSCHRILKLQGTTESAQGIEEKETALGFLNKALDQNPEANLLALLYAQLCACSNDWERGLKEIKTLMGRGNVTPHLKCIGIVVLEASIYESTRTATNSTSTTASSSSDTTNEFHQQEPRREEEEGTRGNRADAQSRTSELIPEEWAEAPRSQLETLQEWYTCAAKASPGCHTTCRRLLLLLRFLKGETIRSCMDEIDALANHLDVCTHCPWGWERMSQLLFEHATLPSCPGWSQLCGSTWNARLLVWRDFHFSSLSILKKDDVVARHQAGFLRCHGAKVVCASFFYGLEFVDYKHARDRMRKWDSASVKQVNEDIARARTMRSEYLEHLFLEDKPYFVTHPHELPSSFWRVFPQHRRQMRDGGVPHAVEAHD